MEKDYPGIQEKIVSAMTLADIDRWGDINPDIKNKQT